MMKERPILFSAAMVRAILDGSKTQTRRICKLPPDAKHVQYYSTPTGRSQSGWADPGVNYWTPGGNHIDPCPYGMPGDRLWVRETFRIGNDVGEGWNESHEPGDLHVIYQDGDRDYKVPIEYWNRIPRNAKEVHNSEGEPDHWISYGPIPGIHMPRWASRIDLEITGVRVERLQDCSKDDAMAEGCEKDHAEGEVLYWFDGLGVDKKSGRLYAYDAKEAYSWLWESINGQGSWDTNPWVWVIEFKVVKP